MLAPVSKGSDFFGRNQTRGLQPAAAGGAAAFGSPVPGESGADQPPPKHRYLPSENGAVPEGTPGRITGGASNPTGPHSGKPQLQPQRPHELRASAQSGGVSLELPWPSGGDSGAGGAHVLREHIRRFSLFPGQHPQDSRRLPASGGRGGHPGP